MATKKSATESESILTSIKKLLGIVEDYTQFDTDIILHINSVFSSLMQLGVGPEDGFHISDKTQTWNDYIGDSKDVQMVISYVYLKVRLLFDPPTNSFLVQSMNDQIKEFEFRLSITSGNNTGG